MRRHTLSITNRAIVHRYYKHLVTKHNPLLAVKKLVSIELNFPFSKADALEFLKYMILAYDFETIIVFGLWFWRKGRFL